MQRRISLSKVKKQLLQHTTKPSQTQASVEVGFITNSVMALGVLRNSEPCWSRNLRFLSGHWDICDHEDEASVLLTTCICPQRDRDLQEQLRKKAQGLRHLHQQKVLPQQSLMVRFRGDWELG